MKLITVGVYLYLKVSPPVRGAWIETSQGGSRSRKFKVAPRAGGVD